MRNDDSMQQKLHEDYKSDTKEKLMPIYYIIEPTNFCNYACTICPNKFYRPEEKGFMEWNLFKKIVLQIKDYAQVIQLYWLGEPLLHSNLCRMIAFCKDNTTAKVMLSTNGSLLDEEYVVNLVNSGLDKLIVSMDAAESQSIYDAIRKNGNLKTLNNNVSNLLKYSSCIDITLQFILTFANKEEKNIFLSNWSDKNIKISVQCLYTWAGQMPELANMSDHLSSMIGQKRDKCADLWYKMAIHWNGKVSLCCFDWSFDNVVGDLTEESVCDVWNSNEINAIRNMHRAFKFEKICEKCDAWALENEYETLFD